MRPTWGEAAEMHRDKVQAFPAEEFAGAESSQIQRNIPGERSIRAETVLGLPEVPRVGEPGRCWREEQVAR